MVLKEGHDLVVEQVGRCQGRLAVVKLSKGHLAVGVDEGLLVDPAYAFERAEVKRVLRPTLPRTLAHKFTMRLGIGLGFL